MIMAMGYNDYRAKYVEVERMSFADQRTVLTILDDIVNREDTIIKHEEISDMVDHIHANKLPNSNKYLVKFKEPVADELDDKVKICSHCGTFMTEGYLINNGWKYYCSDDCLDDCIGMKEYIELHDNGNGNSYYTDWL